MKEFSTWLTPTEAGEGLGISKQAVHGLLARGKLKRAVHTHASWLIDPRSVEEYTERRRERLASPKVTQNGHGAEEG